MQDSSSLEYYMMPIQHKENMQVLLVYKRIIAFYKSLPH